MTALVDGRLRFVRAKLLTGKLHWGEPEARGNPSTNRDDRWGGVQERRVRVVGDW